MSTLDVKIKTKAFEYLSSKMFNWFQEVNLGTGKSIESEFSKLKLIKLHFFACAVTAKPDGDDLLADFNNFYALPLGHVESDIYNLMGKMESITFDRTSIRVNKVDPNYFDDLGAELISKLNNAIVLLRNKNENLINLEPMELVELSHLWNSWDSVFTMARRLNKFSMKIPTELIRNEKKIYSL